MGTLETTNFNDTLPAAETGYRNAKWQADSPTTNPRNVSVEMPNLGGFRATNAATDTIAAADQGKIVTEGYSLPVAVTLDSTVPNWFVCAVEVIGGGTATLTPSSGVIYGPTGSAASMALTTGQGCILFFDGTNWKAITGAASGGTGTVTHITGPLTLNEPIFGNGGSDVVAGTKRGNTTVAQMADNTSNPTTGDLAVFDANGNITDGGSPVVGAGVFAYGGDASDSTCHFDGIANPVAGATLAGSTYTMTRDIWATSFTVDSGIIVLTANWRIFATGTVTNNGTISNDGQTGGTGTTASSATGAGGGTAGQNTNSATAGSMPNTTGLVSTAGTTGGNGTATAGAVAAVGNNGTQTGLAMLPGGGAGSNGNQAGAGGNGIDSGAHAGGVARSAATGGVTPSALAIKPGREPFNVLEYAYRQLGTPSQWSAYGTYSSSNGNATGGSGGGGDGSVSGGGGGGGGGMGGMGGIVLICASKIVNGATGVISAQGGTGGVGGGGFSPTTGTGTGGGGAGAGGSGGNGGYVALIYRTYTNSGTVQFAGGAGGAHGTGGTGHGTGTNGGNGNNGPTGQAGALISIAC